MEGKKRILVVDDDEQIRTLVKEILDRYGYEVWTCAQGNIALDLILEKCFVPHLVITDWQMPVMDGIELIKRIKKMFSPQFPTIIMTGNPDQFEKLPEKPTNEILPKPFMMAELLAKVKRLTNY